MFIRFDMIHERDRQTPDDAIGRAYASHHAAINDLVDTCGSYCDMYITHCNYSQPASIKLYNENIGVHLTPLHFGILITKIIGQRQMFLFSHPSI